MLSRSRAGGFLGLAVLTAALVNGAYDTVEIGGKAVEIEAKKIVNSKFKNLKEFDGALVLYEYFQHW